MRYVLEFFTIILSHPTKFCQYYILLIENFNLYSDEDGVKHIRIKARPNKWHENDCPFCHKSCPAYDKHSSRPTTWRGLDWGGILVEVEYQTHRIICLEHGVYVAEVPWAYPGSRFTKDFDLTVAWFASYLPRSTTSYMKSLFLFGRRWIGYFLLYLTGVRYFCMRSMVSVSLPLCLRYALHMFTAIAKLIL